MLVLATTGCTAQHAPVNIAIELYKGCMVEFTQATNPLPTAPKEIERMVGFLDGQCTQWALIWLPAFIHRDRPELRIDEQIRFAQYRQGLQAGYIKVLKEHRP